MDTLLVRRVDELQILEAPDEAEISLEVLMGHQLGVQLLQGQLLFGKPMQVAYSITGWNPNRQTFSLRKVLDIRT